MGSDCSSAGWTTSGSLKDPQLVEKVRDVVGLYMNPADYAIVLCVDEKSHVQPLKRIQPVNRTITNGTESPRCSRRFMSPVESRLATAGDGSGNRNSRNSSTRSMPTSPRNSMFTWYWIITAPTRSAMCNHGGAASAPPRAFQIDQRELAEPGGTTGRRVDRTMRPRR